MTQTHVLPKPELSSLQILKTGTIVEAMKVIDEGAVQIALVINASGCLTGVLTDGDLRRAIIGGAGLEQAIEPFVPSMFRSVTENTGRSEALDLMKSLRIEQLPILDPDGRPCGLHLLNDLIQPNAIPNPALVLAGGKGTRLGSLTQTIPKPMIKVAGRPILERIVLHLVGSGIRNIFLSVNYLAEVIVDHFGNGERFGCRIEYLHEDQPLGTGGPLAMLNDHGIEHPVVVMNGDLIAEFSLERMVRVHTQHQNAITIGVRTYSHEVPFGCIKTEGKRAVSILEKPTHFETINAGIYVLDPAIVAGIPLEFCPITRVVESAIEADQRVEVFDIDDWIDVGRPDQLSAARGITQ